MATREARICCCDLAANSRTSIASSIDLPVMDYELHVSIPVKGLPLPLFFLDTPPTTPNSSCESWQSSPLPPTPRTPRKPIAPRPSCDPSRIHQSTIIRFQMSTLGKSGTPTVKITASTHGHSLDKVRRRLQWESGTDLENDCECETPIKKSQKKLRRSCEALGRTRYNADADDEMEIEDANLSSPPYSPVESPSCAKSKKKSTASFSTSTTSKVKTCASCKTRKTPLWRDSEDGTPYCNACGIRYKKYRVRCPVCSYIPHKDENINNVCCICGADLVHTKGRASCR